MKRDSHLFASHKFFEEVGSNILNQLAKADFKDLNALEMLCKKIEDYVATLNNHAQWEEEFIFNKFFIKNETNSFCNEHTEIENMGVKLINDSRALINLDLPMRIKKGKLVYLDFRIFYASNLVHFHSEETNFLTLLQERATDVEIRAIDKPIYESMSSDDMVEMLKHLLPPINLTEKKSILDDLRCFNPENFERVIPAIRLLLTHDEAVEIFGQ